MTRASTGEGLEPCPFCDGEAQIEWSFPGGPYVLCNDCGAATFYGKSIGEAIAAWNTRATTTPAAEQVELWREILTFDCTRFPAMEAKAIEWANHIAGPRGQAPYHPDPVGVLEMCEDIARAAIATLESRP